MMERPLQWSERAATCSDRACSGEIPRMSRDSIPRIPVDVEVLLFRSGLELRKDAGAEYEQTALMQLE